MLYSVKLSSVVLFSLLISQPVFAATSSSTKASKTKTEPKVSQAKYLAQPNYIFEQSDIAQYGVSNVYQLLNYLPGFQNVIGENHSAHSQLQVRGSNVESGYLVLMIDGIKVNTLLANDVQMMMPHFDTHLAERVEVYVGGNSAAFGNNGALAVINVITKKSNAVLFELGSNNHYNVIASLAKKTKFGELSFYVKSSEGDGGNYSADNIPSSSFLDDVNYINKPYVNEQISASWQLGHYTVTYYEDKQQQNGFLNNQSYSQGNQFTSKNKLFSNQLQGQLTPRLKYKADLTYSEHELQTLGLQQEGGIRPFSEDYWFGLDWAAHALEFNISTLYALSHDISLEIGGQWKQQELHDAGAITSHLTSDEQNSLPLDRYYLGAIEKISDFGQYANMLQTIESHGLFTNVNWNMSKSEQVSGAIRLERNHGFDDDIALQLMYKKTLNDKSSVSAKYTESFRSPTFYELFSQDALAMGNEEISPGKIKTVELSYFYTEKTWDAQVTSFYQRLSETIGLTELNELSATQTRYFDNLSEQETFGVESKATYQFNKNWKARGTLTHYFNDTENNEFTTFSALSLLGDFGDFTMGLHSILRSEVNVTSLDEFSATNQTQFKEPSTALINAVFNYQLGRSMSFSLKIENALNQQHNVYDSSQAQNQYYVPQQNKFTSFTFRFDF